MQTLQPDHLRPSPQASKSPSPPRIITQPPDSRPQTPYHGSIQMVSTCVLLSSRHWTTVPSPLWSSSFELFCAV